VNHDQSDHATHGDIVELARSMEMLHGRLHALLQEISMSQATLAGDLAAQQAAFADLTSSVNAAITKLNDNAAALAAAVAAAQAAGGATPAQLQGMADMTASMTAESAALSAAVNALPTPIPTTLPPAA
jgi:ABC-type transporter Mla subunit MlaD